mmetsp:Transcript_33556/g.81116  ORF Transcript_33556/g.81116 Transcript_33556/m.81116 type:complete len:112 (+) Transcript_33556:77-412(+)
MRAVAAVLVAAAAMTGRRLTNEEELAEKYVACFGMPGEAVSKSFLQRPPMDQREQVAMKAFLKGHLPEYFASANENTYMKPMRNAMQDCGSAADQIEKIISDAKKNAKIDS